MPSQYYNLACNLEFQHCDGGIVEIIMSLLSVIESYSLFIFPCKHPNKTANVHVVEKELKLCVNLDSDGK